MVAKIYNLNEWIDNIDPTELKTYFDELLTNSKFNILGFIDFKFEPIGWTGLWLLGESHFAIHTFPEEQKTYIELSSCNEDYYKYFKNNLFNSKITKYETE